MRKAELLPVANHADMLIFVVVLHHNVRQFLAGQAAVLAVMDDPFAGKPSF